MWVGENGVVDTEAQAWGTSGWGGGFVFVGWGFQQNQKKNQKKKKKPKKSAQNDKVKLKRRGEKE